MKKTKPSVAVGDEVAYHARIGGTVTSTGHRIQTISILNGRTVAWISGKAGCVAIEALSHETGCAVTQAETALSAPVAAWLREQGLTVFTEVPLGVASARVVDMVGYDAATGRVVLVELKRNCSRSAWQQVQDCQMVTPDTYLATGGRPTRASRDEAVRMYIGLLTVKGGAVSVVFHPRETEAYLTPWRGEFIKSLSHMPRGGNCSPRS